VTDPDLDNQLAQLEELLSLFDTSTLQAAQQAVEHQIAELSDRLETTRQALTHAQSQRRRLARARLLLEENPSAAEPAALEPEPERPAKAPVQPQQSRIATSPPDLRPVVDESPAPAEAVVGGSYLPDRRRSDRRRHNGN
jgi:hypothetical protein